MKIAVVLGTRPEIIKMSSIMRELEKNGDDYFIVHSGQHYSYDMDKTFFDCLALPNPKYNLGIGSGTHADQTGKILMGLENILKKECPGILLVQGDTNTTMAGALAAVKLSIKTGHIEAGLRSYDRRMPEEINRVITDHVSDLLFAPTQHAKSNLLREGIPGDTTFIVGNTIVDAIFQNIGHAGNHGNVQKEFGLQNKNYILVTLHRPENVDSRKRLKKIIQGLQRVGERYSLPVIFPVHPRTQKNLDKSDICSQEITFISPQGFFDFLHLESQAKLIMTDSGGVQEEACVLGVPCVTLRENTERPETLDIGANTLAPVSPGTILACAGKMLRKEPRWVQPFGDGHAAEKILDIVRMNGE
jgi:UDP-N-acetylglucosamine 2-epimerase (non-hydrolysing)